MAEYSDEKVKFQKEMLKYSGEELLKYYKENVLTNKKSEL